MNKWIKGKIIKIKYWTKELFSLIVHAEIKPFIAGQYTKLGLNNDDGKIIQRAYSYVNAPKNKDLEFYIASAPDGKFSLMLNQLRPNDFLMITKESKGFFTIDRVPYCKNLWMLATGTAIGPYLSILEQNENLEKFENIILVHAVRFAKDLSYLSKMYILQKIYGSKLHIKTIVSREQTYPNSLYGRIPALIANGSLEKSLSLKLNINNSHVMLCGNPQMIKDTQKILIEIHGMQNYTQKKLGNITSENYW